MMGLELPSLTPCPLRHGACGHLYRKPNSASVHETHTGFVFWSSPLPTCLYVFPNGKAIIQCTIP